MNFYAHGLISSPANTRFKSILCVVCMCVCMYLYTYMYSFFPFNMCFSFWFYSFRYRELWKWADNIILIFTVGFLWSCLESQVLIISFFRLQIGSTRRTLRLKKMLGQLFSTSMRFAVVGFNLKPGREQREEQRSKTSLICM